MSPTSKRYPSPSSKDQEQAAQAAVKELDAQLKTLEFDERVAIIWLARWYQKWYMVAGPRKLGRILLELARDPRKDPRNE